MRKSVFILLIFAGLPFYCAAQTVFYRSGFDLTYECLGNVTDTSNLYQINYTRYQPCSSFDNGLVLTISEGDTVIGGLNSADSSNVFIDTIPLPLYPCFLELPEYCLIRKKKSFYVELPLSNVRYLFYQEDIARYEDLVNVVPPVIINGIDRYGFSHFIELTPQAQQICNSSPQFETAPTTILCDQEPFVIDLSGLDQEGHQIVYEFYNPYDRVDIDLLNTPPPYPFIPFLLPEYSFSNPLGNNAEINLDPNTGILTGTSNGVGLYLVGIKAMEYVDGSLLSTCYRDFNLNFVSCASNVQALLENEFQNDEGTYIYNVCNESELTILNESIDESAIDNFYWEIDGIIYDDWNPTIQFNSSGQFEGQLFLNPGAQCADSASFSMNVNRFIDADFSTTFDSCVSGPVDFLNNSFSEGTVLSDFNWSFGNNTFSTDRSPNYRFDAPGSHEVTLSIIDEFGCKDTVSHVVDWQPAPAVLIVAPETAAGCAPLSTTFNNFSWPIDSNYIIEWDFGDGNNSFDEIEPSHSYNLQGVFDVAVFVESPIGCQTDTVFQNLIRVDDPPIADFSYSPEQLSQFNSTVNFLDNSERAVQWRWSFSASDSTWLQEPTYTFNEVGIHPVQLIVNDVYGCADTLLQNIEVIPAIAFHLPNAFSPNGDGINDSFQAVGVFDDLIDFELHILNRWGEVLFSTTNPDFEWQGFNLENNQIFPKGTYVYRVSFSTTRGETQQLQGYVNLIR